MPGENRIADALREDEKLRAALDLESQRQSGANYRAGLAATAHRYAANAAIAPEMNKQEGLGDIGASYGGGRLDLAATQKAAPLVPVGTGPETGKWEKVGPLEVTAGDGTFNRPAYREVVGAEGGPVHVLRGTRSSYAGGAPGEEWGSLQRAAQAINRATDQGEYAPPGASMEALKHQNKLDEITAQGKSQEAQLAGDMMTRKRNLETFMNRVQSDPRFYKEGPEGLAPAIPGLGQLVLGFKSLGEAEPEKAWQAFEAKALRHLDEGKWVNEQGITTAIDNLQKAGYTLTPGQKNWLLSQHPDAGMEKKRRDTIIQWANPTSIPDGTPGGTPQGRGPLQVSPLSLEGNAQPIYVRPGQPLSPGAGLPQPGNMAPLRPLSGPLGAGSLRPDQYSRMIEDQQREQQQEAARKKQLGELSTELERRIGLQ